MTKPIRIAWIAARWHADIVDQALVGARAAFGNANVEIDVFPVPGALEIPLKAQRLAPDYDAVVGCAFVVDGGIYRHDFVAQSVLDGIVRVGLGTDTPVLSVVLTPHHFQPTAEHQQFFAAHFVEKGAEAARAILMLSDEAQQVQAA
ncbi:6,7-dimethyl-8-ribityllumazine synthase [Rubricella aquisinus]|uniref:6,7-dimethyl-8-ribityllumazine synthase n=2 Tax=Rubricella aquisinus TaxID=2028108 RepID=A0A840WPN3_9RHOB|nr:6,7-dimethyl-8-ribityllumazine synthase [Rubricella aquisinus]